MAKRRKEDLESVRDFCDRTYSGAYGSKLHVNTEKQFDPNHFDLGYCYKFTEEGTGVSIYQIVCAKLGIPETDFRVMMHEYGHIYLGHLDGIHEELDQKICDLFQNRRNELVDSLNEKLGIDFASSLIDRVIDDPQLNHSLHNIAMDMEVNDSVLSEEDIEEMEADISSTYPKYSKELSKFLEEHEGEITEEQKKELQDKVKKMDDAVKVKLILPNRYELSKGVPFPGGLTYPDYLLMIVQHLDQFVKMLVSLKMGMGLNGNVSMDDIKNMLNNPKRDWKNATPEYKKGYQDALNDLKNGNQQKQNRPQGGQQQPGQQGPQIPGAGMPGQQGQPMPGGGGAGQQGQGQGQPQAGQGGGAGQGQGQPQQGQGAGHGQGYDPQAEYDRGYQDALNDAAQNAGQGQGGQGDALGQLLGEFFGKDGAGADGIGPWQDKPDHYTERRGIRDHDNQGRKEADHKRQVGQIKAGGGIGCGSRGGAEATREVDHEVDAVDMALNEVIRNMRHRVIKLDTKKDLMRNYNRGIVRSVIAPAVMRKVTVSNEQKIVYLIDISGSMDTLLVDRILKAIKRNMMHLSKGLKYDIITWNTSLGEHIKDINPRRPVPRISYGGGTMIADGIRYFRDNYGPEATLIVISDFEDNLEEWNEVEKKMNGYLIYGFNYGTNRWGRSSNDIPWKNLRLKNFYDKAGN